MMMVETRRRGIDQRVDDLIQDKIGRSRSKEEGYESVGESALRNSAGRLVGRVPDSVPRFGQERQNTAREKKQRRRVRGDNTGDKTTS